MYYSYASNLYYLLEKGYLTDDKLLFMTYVLLGATVVLSIIYWFINYKWR